MIICTHHPGPMICSDLFAQTYRLSTSKASIPPHHQVSSRPSGSAAPASPPSDPTPTLWTTSGRWPPTCSGSPT